MMTPLTAPSQAAYAYDVLAPYYDDFTAGYAYGRWIEAIEDRAVALGLSGRRALDLACGTGKSTGELIARGYYVLACDISPGMLEVCGENARRLDCQVHLQTADAERLPYPDAQFDLGSRSLGRRP